MVILAIYIVRALGARKWHSIWRILNCKNEFSFILIFYIYPLAPSIYLLSIEFYLLEMRGV